MMGIRVKCKEIKGSHTFVENQQQIDSLKALQVNILTSFKSRKRKINNLMNKSI